MTEHSRGEHKKIKQKGDTGHVPHFPLWLRFVIFIALVIICLTAGALFGYSDLGGGRAADVFKESTWTHIYDLVEKK